MIEEMDSLTDNGISNHFVFYKFSQAGIILLVMYVDDIIITGNDMAGISSLKSFLHGQFHTKDLGMPRC